MATHLEKSLQQGRDLLSTYENKLVTDDTVPEDLRVIDRKKEELLVSVSCSQLSILFLFYPIDVLHIQNCFPKAVAAAAQVPNLNRWQKDDCPSGDPTLTVPAFSSAPTCFSPELSLSSVTPAQ